MRNKSILIVGHREMFLSRGQAGKNCEKRNNLRNREPFYRVRREKGNGAMQ